MRSPILVHLHLFISICETEQAGKEDATTKMEEMVGDWITCWGEVKGLTGPVKEERRRGSILSKLS